MNIVATCLFATVVILKTNASVAVIVAAANAVTLVSAGNLMSVMLARCAGGLKGSAAIRAVDSQAAVSTVMKIAAAVVAAAIHVFATPLQWRTSLAVAAPVH